MSCKWQPLKVAPLEQRKKAAMERMIELQKTLCFHRIQDDEPCNVYDPNYYLCPGCESFKRRWNIPTIVEE